MNEKLRVRFSIFAWVAMAVAVVGCAIYVVGRGDIVPPENTVEQPNEVLPAQLVYAAPADVGLDAERLERIDAIVERYLERELVPGAVVGVMRHDKIVYAKAFGLREVVDASVPMTLDTRFDLASMTKPIATATAIMQLVERGTIRLNERVDNYIPNFEGWVDEDDKRDTTHIRILDLLTHNSGLPAYATPKQIVKMHPDVELPNRDTVVEYIAHLPRLSKPRTECRYSCLNFVILSEIVERATGVSFDSYVEDNILAPLGMTNSCFTPDSEYAECCAPTTPDGSGWMLRGVVHDPLSREALGGVSGNAGLFSTLDDIMKFSAMMLNGGKWGGVELLSPRSVEVLLNEPRGFEQWDRTVGWESFCGYSSTAGDLLSSSAVGHTGATGTSIIIDPELDLAIVILTNKVHRTTSEHIVELRSRVATLVGAAIVE